MLASQRAFRFLIGLSIVACMELLHSNEPLRVRSRAPALVVAGAILSVVFLSGARCPDAISLQQQADVRAVHAASSADRLEIISVTSERIRGRLIHGSTGVAFDSSKNDETAALVVKTLQGEELLSVRDRDSKVVVAIDDGRLSVEIDRKVLLELRRAQSDGTLTRLLHAPPMELRARLGTLTEAEGNADVAQRFQNAPEYALLPALSWQLGKLGITGRSFPPSLAIHVLGLAAAKALEIDPRRSGIAYTPVLLPETDADGDTLAEMMQRAGSDCWHRGTELPNPQSLPECPGQCETSPDPAQECTGMCGRGCLDCWDWVCGDCCYHNFCAIHDAATRACEEVSDAGFCVIAVLPWYFVMLGCGAG